MESGPSSEDVSLQSYNKSPLPGENIEILDEKVSVISQNENVDDEDEEISNAHTFESHLNMRSIPITVL